MQIIQSLTDLPDALRGGAVAIGVEISGWLLICTVLLALFLALNWNQALLVRGTHVAVGPAGVALGSAAWLVALIEERRGTPDAARAAAALADTGRLLSETLDPGLVGQRITDSVRELFGDNTVDGLEQLTGLIKGRVEVKGLEDKLLAANFGLISLPARHRERVTAGLGVWS